MQKILGVLRRVNKKYVYIGGALVIIVGAVIFFRNGSQAEATLLVARGDFTNFVQVSGKVVTKSEADLGFASSGRIGKIFVRENQSIKAGQILAQLEIGDLLAELKIKEVNSKQENTEVESAYRALLSEDLEFVANSSNYSVEAPEVTGIYAGGEGSYKVRIIRDDITSSKLHLLTFGLENSDTIINEQGPTILGSKGLYISFPEDVDNYVETIWYLNIPNKASSSYLANYNTYMEAKAEFESQNSASAVSSVVQAEIDKIRSEIRKSTIYSPFDGIVTKVDKEVGEIAAQNEAVISAESKGAFQIETYIPEVNIALVKIGDSAQATLDAYGENQKFPARVISIDSAETLRDGVSTYKVKLELVTGSDDQRIKSGMTANVSIFVFYKTDVIVLPGGVISLEDGKNFVEVKKGKKTEKRQVELGAVSSLGQVEIVSGLEVGEEVLLKPESAGN